MRFGALKRRLPALLVAVLALVGVGTAARSTPDATETVFGTFDESWMPHATATAAITEAWFCPGVPATGEGGVEGLVRIANRSDEPLSGSVLLMNNTNENTRIEIEVPAFEISIVELENVLPGEFTAAVVEIEGGGALVEQVSRHPEGDSLSACSNSTGDEWYLADGFTVDGSLNHVLLTNPYEQTVVAKLEFATADAVRSPANYASLAIPARSVRAIDLGAPGAGAQGEELLAVSVTASRGRLVVGRSQQFTGGGRSGSQVSVASPTLADQWRFSGGNHADGFDEQYTVYNPTETSVQVIPIVVGFTPELAAEGTVDPVGIEPFEVPAGRVVSFDPSDIDGFPNGAYSIIFGSPGQQSIVVERATTQADGDEIQTTVMAGAISEPSTGYIATQWHVPAGPDEPTEDALIINNADNAEGTVTVYAVGSSGAVPVPSLTDIVLPPTSETLRIDLTDEAVLGRELIVQTTNRVVVERWYPSGRGDTRTAAWALPADRRAGAEGG